MKVIELLTKIANGEEVPKKILYKYSYKNYYKEYHLKWNEKYKGYYTTNDKTPITHLLADNLWNLNDEVEIIEDKPFNERVEEIYNRHIDYIYGKEDKKIEKLEHMNSRDYLENRDEYLSTKGIALDIETLRNWINKIIDYINKEDK